MNILDMLFPKNCLECGRGNSYICSSCIQKVQYATTICPTCERFSFYGRTHPQCISNNTLNGVITIWEHSGVIKKAISAIKYKFAYNAAVDVSAAAAIEIIKFKLSPHCQCAAVPLSTHRENWRGFNQSDKLARELCNRLGWNYFPQLLVRTKDTTPQVHLQKKKRLRNIRGKIAVNMAIFGKIDIKTPLVIVDDVWTTGATTKECCRLLKQAGMKDVWGLTIAKA